MCNRADKSLLPLLAVVTLALLAGCTGQPQPTVCLTCETGIEEASGQDIDLTVESSQLEIRARADGTTRWTVRSRLSGPGVDRLRSNPDLVAELATDAARGDDVIDRQEAGLHDRNVRNVTGHVEGDTLVVSFTVDRLAEQGFGGVLLVDFRTADSERSTLLLGTDRVTVYGPAGTTVTHAPEGAALTRDGRGVVWQRAESVFVPGNVLAAFGPSDGDDIGALTTRIAVVSHTAAWAVPATTTAGLPYALVVGFVLVVLTRQWSRRPLFVLVGEGDAVLERLLDRPPIGLAVVSVAYTGLFVGLFDGSLQEVLGRLFVAPPLAPIAMLFVLGLFAHRDPRWRRSIALALVGSAFVMVGVALVSPPRSIYASVSVLFPFLGMLLFGVPLLFLGTRLSWVSGRQPQRKTE